MAHEGNAGGGNSDLLMAQKVLGYAQLAFSDMQELDDYISECASLVLSIDGLARSAEVILACNIFMDLRGRSGVRRSTR